MALLSKRLRLEARRARRPLVMVGILVACSLGVLAALVANQTFQRPWERYDDYRVAFDDVKGVVPGQQEVRIAGIKVGLISSARLDRGRPVLGLAVEHKYGRLFRDATFRLRPKTPLQDMYVEISRGHPRAGRLSAHTIVPASQTVTPVDVSRVLQTFDAGTRQRLTTLLVGFGRGTADRGEALRSAFVELAPFLTTAADVTHALATRRVRLERLVTASGGLITRLSQHDRQLAGLIADADTTLGTLARRDVPLGPTLRELPGTLGALRDGLTQLGRAQDELDPALVDLKPLARRVGPALTALTRVSGDLRPAAVKLRPAVAALRPFVRSLRPAASALATSATQLRPQVTDFDVATRRVSECEQSVQQFFDWTLDVVKFRDGFNAYPRGNVSGGAESLASPVRVPLLTKQPTCTGEGSR